MLIVVRVQSCKFLLPNRSGHLDRCGPFGEGHCRGPNDGMGNVWGKVPTELGMLQGCSGTRLAQKVTQLHLFGDFWSTDVWDSFQGMHGKGALNRHKSSWL